MALISLVIVVILLFNPFYSLMDRVILEERLYYLPLPLIARVTGLDTILITLQLFAYSMVLWFALYFLLTGIQSSLQPDDSDRKPPVDLLTTKVGSQAIFGGTELLYAHSPAFVIRLANLLANAVRAYFFLFIGMNVLWNAFRYLGVGSLGAIASQVIPILYLFTNPGPLTDFSSQLGPDFVGQLLPRIPTNQIVKLSPSLAALAFLVLFVENRWVQEKITRYWQDLDSFLRREKYQQNKIKVQ